MQWSAHVIVIEARGLGAVAAYDPYLGRSITAIKYAIADGRPVMVRLHAAAQYPAPREAAVRTDREGHAVLIVGYDDNRRALAVLDPWDPAWGGEHHGRRWISYDDFALQVVDASLGFAMVASPLDVDVVLVPHGEQHVLGIQVGFYEPRGQVMDRVEQRITRVDACVDWPTGWSATAATASVEGHWPIGERATLELAATPDASASAVLELELTAQVAGTRPYVFDDEIRTTVAVSLSAASTAEVAARR